MVRGVVGASPWIYCLGFILASCSARADYEADQAERYKRAVLYGSFAGYGLPPPVRPVPAAVGAYAAPFAAPAAAVVAAPLVEPMPLPPPPPPLPPGSCPGGPSLGKPCDAKRPWPQCPPQSYCFAVNSVDIGPYFCCPVWSTVGAQWRPAAPLYPYYPPMPFNWPYVIQATAHWGAQTSPAAGWVGQFGPPPPGPVGPVGGAVVGPAMPEGPFPGPGPVGPFEKRKKDPEAIDSETEGAIIDEENS